MLNTLNKTEIEGSFLNKIKNTHRKSTTNVMVSIKRLNFLAKTQGWKAAPGNFWGDRSVQDLHCDDSFTGVHICQH